MMMNMYVENVAQNVMMINRKNFDEEHSKFVGKRFAEELSAETNEEENLIWTWQHPPQNVSLI